MVTKIKKPVELRTGIAEAVFVNQCIHCIKDCKCEHNVVILPNHDKVVGSTICEKFECRYDCNNRHNEYPACLLNKMTPEEIEKSIKYIFLTD